LSKTVLNQLGQNLISTLISNITPKG